MLSRKPDQQPNDGVHLLLPFPAPPVEEESGDPATAGPRKIRLARVKLDDQLFVDDRRDFLGALGVLILWGGVQQWILQTVVLREVQRATGRRRGVIVAALLFAAVHLPNPLLSTVTLAGALGWCAIYDRYPNIVPLALSHACGALALLYAFDDTITGGLRIGHAFLAHSS